MRVRKADQGFSNAVLDDELVIVDAATGLFFATSGVGLEIWQALDRTDDLDTIIANLEAVYDVDPATCRKDVERFADSLVERGFAHYV